MTRWLLLACLAACGDDGVMQPGNRVLVFTKATGARHDDALTAAKTALPMALQADMVTPDFTEDPTQFNATNLDRYRAVIFLYTSGDNLLDDAGKTALEQFVRHGGGWMGVHSACETETTWPFYKTMLVSYSAGETTPMQATVTVALPSHQAMRDVPAGPWIASDGWYNFTTSPRSTLSVDVLMTVDESTYTGGTMGADHPIAWVQERLVGRTLFTAIGHDAARWQEPAFLAHIASSVRWVTGLAL